MQIIDLGLDFHQNSNFLILYTIFFCTACFIKHRCKIWLVLLCIYYVFRQIERMKILLLNMLFFLKLAVLNVNMYLFLLHDQGVLHGDCLIEIYHAASFNADLAVHLVLED